MPILSRRLRPSLLSYGVAGLGSSSYLAGELLQRELGLTMQPVTYRGGAQTAAAVAAGDVPSAFTDTAAILPMIASGQAVALGVAEPVRSRAMPNIPTLREAGVPDFSAMSWLAMFAPRGTPDDRIARLNAGIAKNHGAAGSAKGFARRRPLSLPPTARPTCAASSKWTMRSGAN